MSTAEALAKRYVGTELGSFKLVELVGTGGMGAVFRAQHKKVNLQAAIKILRDANADEAAVARFLQEAKLLSRLDHPSLVKLHDCGSLPDGALYLQMEYLQGQPLPAYVRDRGGTLSAAEVITLGRQAASALACIHRAGVLHRDVKPSNLFVVADPEAPGGHRLKVLDFGIAKLRGTATTSAVGAATPSTQSGQILGTPRYMSPEQCEGTSELDERSDVYSLGLIFYELLSGESPYPVPQEPMGWLFAHVQKRPRPIQQAVPELGDSLGTSLTALIMQMLDKLAAQRPSMVEVEATLGALLAGVAPPAVVKRAAKSPPVWLLGLGEGIALLGVSVSVMPRLLPLRWPWTRQSSLSERRVALAELQARAPRGTVLIPGGRFTLGSNEAEIDAALADCQQHRKDCQRDEYERERPLHVVTVSDFFLDQFEVTNGDFAAFLNRPLRPTYVEDGRLVMAERALLVDIHPKASGIVYQDGRFAARPGFQRKPVVQVTWQGAQDFCAAQGRRLPREAEWELAARSGQRRAPYPWTGFALSNWPWKTEQGEQPRCDGVVMARAPGQSCASADPAQPSFRTPQDVGTAPQDVSPQGAYDLAGNVREWVEDEFRTQYPDCGACKNPLVAPNAPLGTVMRVVRGGNFQQEPTATRSAGRSRWRADYVATGIGFRCAFNPENFPAQDNER